MNYSAVIDWGDQSAPSSSDTITYDPATGQFSVPGSHTYAQVGDYTIGITIQHDSATPVIVTTSIQVGHVQPTAAVTGVATGATGQSLTFTVSASDPIPSLNAAGFAYSIDWADGSQASTVPATANNGSGVDVSHAFAAGSYTVLVTATDQSGNTATASIDVRSDRRTPASVFLHRQAQPPGARTSTSRRSSPSWRPAPGCQPAPSRSWMATPSSAPAHSRSLTASIRPSSQPPR